MLAHLKIIWQFHAHPVHQKVSRYIGDDFFLGPNLVRDSSVVRRHYIFLLEPSNVRAQYIRNTADLSSGSAHFHVSWLLDFIFYPKPLCKSLHQSFFYSFITILPSESSAILHCCTILP